MKRTKELLALMMVSVKQAAVDRGDWRLDLGLQADFVGGASQSDVPGEVPELGASLKAIWPACPAAMDCCVSIIPERSRGPIHQERRNHQKDSESRISSGTSCIDRTRCRGVRAQEASLPQKTESQSCRCMRGRSPPCDLVHAKDAEPDHLALIVERGHIMRTIKRPVIKLLKTIKMSSALVAPMDFLPVDFLQAQLWTP